MNQDTRQPAKASLGPFDRRPPGSPGVDIDKAWDNRMRLDLAERYDSRKNMIDWDYHMGLGDLGPLIKFQGVPRGIPWP